MQVPSRHMVPNSLWSATLPLHSCLCVCAAFAITGWVVNRKPNSDRAERAQIKLMLKLRMMSESAWTYVDYNAFVESLKYYRIHIINYIRHGIVLSDKQSVRGKSCWGNLQLPNFVSPDIGIGQPHGIDAYSNSYDLEWSLFKVIHLLQDFWDGIFL